MQPIFRSEILINQSNVNLRLEILFRKIIRQLDPKLRKMFVKGFELNENSTFYADS